MPALWRECWPGVRYVWHPLQFAVSLLNRHRAAVEGRRVAGRGARRATAEETDAALARKLDALARQMVRS